MLKKKQLCLRCGGTLPDRQEKPWHFCPLCGAELPAAQPDPAELSPEALEALYRRKLEEEPNAIPQMPTSLRKKTRQEYTKEALMWAVMVGGFIGILMLLYGIAGQMR